MMFCYHLWIWDSIVTGAGSRWEEMHRAALWSCFAARRSPRGCDATRCSLSMQVKPPAKMTFSS